MGLKPTKLFKTFTFDGETSDSYGAFLTGEGVFDAPERVVDMVEVPGRNGAFAMDKGRFENVELTYQAYLVDETDEDFADRISALRNWLCSKVGYVRLEDDYNPDEYRMVVYKSGLEVDHKDLEKGDFEITFDCKPQRWLKVGENEYSVADNGTLTNPTLFDSSPLLAVEGYGDISFNGYTLNIQNATFGNIYVADNDTWAVAKSYTLNNTLLNGGDSITVNCQMSCRVGYYFSGMGTETTQLSETNALFHTTSGNRQADATQRWWLLNTNIDAIGFNYGTSGSETNTVSFGATGRGNYTITQTISYDGANTITVSMSVTATPVGANTVFYDNDNGTTTIIANSTKSVLGNPTYIDCDIGECYMIQNDEIITLNNVMSFGSDLPVLGSGVNTFDYDNTITDLKVVPRWWQV